MTKYLPLFIITVTILHSCNQANNKPVFVGLNVYKDYDSSRTFDTTKASKNTYRPVKIDVFYPSTQKPTDPALAYGDIMDMYEQRFNFTNPIDSCRKTSVQIAQSFCQYYHIDTATRFLQYPLGIYSALALPEKKCPLIIYASSMNGSAFENPVLFDSLAQHGYVVAVVSSVGKYPGFMSEAVDVDEQVRDILFTIDKMKTMPYIDAEKIGIASWSLGGTTAMKAAMISTDIKCIASFDGTEIHAYGTGDTAWDKEYNDIRKLPPYTPKTIAVPYLYLRSEHPKKIDSIYNPVIQTASTNKFFLKFKDAIHEDFSCFPVIAKQVQPSLKDINMQYHADVNKLTLLFFDEYLKKDEGKDVGAYITKLVSSDSVHYDSKVPVY